MANITSDANLLYNIAYVGYGISGQDSESNWVSFNFEPALPTDATDTTAYDDAVRAFATALGDAGLTNLSAQKYFPGGADNNFYEDFSL